MSVLKLFDIAWGLSKVYDAYRRAPRGGRRLATLGAMLVFGVSAPRWYDLRNGVDKYSGVDWRAHEVAYRAWSGANAGRGVHHPTMWVLGAQVQRTWKDPGHCDMGMRDPEYDYRAEVRTYTIFMFHLQRVDATCGARRFAPSAPPTR